MKPTTATFLAAVVVVASGLAPQNPLYQTYGLGPAGVNDAVASMHYTELSGNPSIQFRLTTSDTVEYVMGTATLDVTGNTITFEGSTDDTSEATLTVTDPTADRTLTLPDHTGLVNISNAPVAGGAALTVTQALHAGLNGCIALDTAAGTTITLPAATGTGDRYCFIVTVTPTSNQHRIAVVGDDEFVGSAILSQDAGDTLVMFEAADAADNDHLNMNSSTQGGEVGDYVEVWDCLTDNWCVRYIGQGSGTEATPFNTGQVS